MRSDSLITMCGAGLKSDHGYNTMMERWEQFQGVYVHTPFCLQKCLYCDFPSYAGFTEAVRQQYVDALCREIKTRSLQRELPVAENATVYFGGGTPTVLSVGQIQKIVACLKEYGWWKEPAEATIEANPGTVDAEKLKALRETLGPVRHTKRSSIFKLMF